MARKGLDIVVIPGRKMKLQKGQYVKFVMRVLFSHIIRLVPPILNKGVSARNHLPVAKLLKICVLNDLASWELLDLHLIVLFALVPIIASDDATLNRKKSSQDRKREFCPR